MCRFSEKLRDSYFVIVYTQTTPTTDISIRQSLPNGHHVYLMQEWVRCGRRILWKCLLVSFFLELRCRHSPPRLAHITCVSLKSQKLSQYHFSCHNNYAKPLYTCNCNTYTPIRSRIMWLDSEFWPGKGMDVSVSKKFTYDFLVRRFRRRRTVVK